MLEDEDRIWVFDGCKQHVVRILGQSLLLYLRQAGSHVEDIEQQQGRVRSGKRWGPRTLDLDLLLYGDHQITSDRLTVPHPGLGDRNFVLYPLYDIAGADLHIPGLGLLGQLLQAGLSGAEPEQQKGRGGPEADGVAEAVQLAAEGAGRPR